MRARKLIGIVAAAALLLVPGQAWANDPVAVVTEIQARSGKVEVKAAGADWQSPKPLLSLRAGDQVRAIGDGRAVLLFTGGRGTQVVTAANSPFTIPAQATEATSDRARTVLGNVTSFLIGQQRDKTYQSLSVRSVRAQPPLILAPRDTRVLPGPLTFEWAGSDRLKYRVRLLGPQNSVVWEQDGLERRSALYPSTAPALTAGTRYTWELQTQEYGVQKASFEVAPAADATRVRDSLGLLAPGASQSYPPATLALMRAGLLFQETLYADARRELLTAIAASPDEPTLRLLLGHVYERTGLTQLAATEFDEAEALSAPKK
jgi:hypothetical protein